MGFLGGVFLSSGLGFYTMQRNFVKSGQTLRGTWAAVAIDKSRGIKHIVDKVFFVFFLHSGGLVRLERLSAQQSEGCLTDAAPVFYDAAIVVLNQPFMQLLTLSQHDI